MANRRPRQRKRHQVEWNLVKEHAPSERRTRIMVEDP